MPNTCKQIEDIEFWSIDRVVEGQGISKSTRYTLVRKNLAPQPVNTTAKRKAWIKNEIMAYRQSLIDARDNAAESCGYQANSTINQ